MKKRNWLLSACTVFLLGACSDETAQEPVDPAQDEATPTEIEEDVASESASEQKDSAQIEEQENAEEQESEEASEQAAKPRYRINPQNSKVEAIGDANEQAVLITIDDAPDTYALEMAKTLKELDVPAIFFVNGHFLDTEEEQENLSEIHDMGFAIGNHTNTHVNLKQSTESVQQEEILLLNDRVEAIIGEAPKFFRAPFGVNTEFSKALVQEQGMVRMNWTYGYDYMQGYMETDALTDIMVNAPELNNGGNLLMHDREWTNEALPQIIEGLRKKGYEFVDPNEIEGI
ncbi:polysaccharide deacetylase family protein [Planococcus maritimus]|uniref:polysaccharide deacetylase family protein n=1 Tax=Planococcus maritimus TaxID=192421 RepID=UPI00079A8F7F|nr:polysaccharide deacetylase family protein [Planococcus maritimus]KYG59097.1 polysaccharide deacetylase [Planococcus maritimus]OED32802.1 polysaccharide deacetylase [Planococcus maritimus]